MKTKSYIIVTRRSGKRKVYTTERYRFLKGLKFAATMLLALAVMILLCGMAAVDDCPAKAFRLIVMIGIGLLLLIMLLYRCLEDMKNDK